MNFKARVLIVDDEAHQRQILTEFLASRGFESTAAANGMEALALLKKENPGFQIVITDLTMPELDGIGLVTQAKQLCPETDFLVLTGNGTMESAIAALRAGASDFLLKPVDFKDIDKKLHNLLKVRALEDETQWLKAENKRLRGGVDLIGESPVMKALIAELSRVLENNVSVLLMGETGTGKEVVGRYLHENGLRKNGPFVAINCSAIPENLTESHFFGHEKGAFTGAERRVAGCFERADGGTLFMDEIGEMDLKIQPKILRVLEERQVTRVGGTGPVKVDVRVVAATNRNLSQMVAQGKFREDLLYRLNVVQLTLPPLRERKEDLMRLVRSLVDRHSKNLNVKVSGIDDSFFDVLRSMPFPGNVRELSNVIERALLYVTDGKLTNASVGGTSGSSGAVGLIAGVVARSEPLTGSLADMMDAFEQRTIQSALSANNDDVEKAAKQLGISRSTLYSKISKRSGA